MCSPSHYDDDGTVLTEVEMDSLYRRESRHYLLRHPSAVQCEQGVCEQEGCPVLRSRYILFNLCLDIQADYASKLQTQLTRLGAFTPGCSARHLPGFIQKLSEIKAKGVDIVAVIAYNDPFVMSAWGKANNVKGDDIVRTISSCKYTELMLILHSSSCPTTERPSRVALAGPRASELPDMLSSLTMGRSPMPRKNPAEM